MASGSPLKTGRRSWLLQAARLLLALAAVGLILIQLVPGVYVVREFWSVSVPSPVFSALLVSSMISDPGFWRLLVSSLLCVVLAGVVVLVIIQPHLAWKFYVMALALMIVALALSVLAAQFHALPHTDVLLKGEAIVLARGVLTLLLLYGYAKLTEKTSRDGMAT